MKTAEELIESIYIEGTGAGEDCYNEGDIKRIMIDFAKLHVEQALTEASKVARCKEQITMQGLNVTIIKSSILNAYPSEKIK